MSILYHLILAPDIGFALKLHVKVTDSPSTAWIISVEPFGLPIISGLNLTLMVVVCFKWCTPLRSSKAELDAKQERLVNSLWALKVSRLRVWNVRPLSSRVTSSWISSCEKWKRKSALVERTFNTSLCKREIYVRPAQKQLMTFSIFTQFENIFRSKNGAMLILLPA